MIKELKVGATYKHIKTGNLYRLEQDHLLCKTDIKSERIYYADSFDVEFKDTYCWKQNLKNDLVLYKALYDNADGPYFVRYIKDFCNEFEEYVKPAEQKECADCVFFYGCCRDLKNKIGFDATKCEDFSDFDEQ